MLLDDRRNELLQPGAGRSRRRNGIPHGFAGNVAASGARPTCENDIGASGLLEDLASEDLTQSSNT